MIFFDTSVLVAALFESHQGHHRALQAFHQATARAISTHAVAETYAILSGLPVSPRIGPTLAHHAVLSIVQSVKVIELNGEDYSACLREAEIRHVQGGAIYDLLHVRAADKAGATQIMTFNLRHFRALVSDPARICEP